MELTLADMLESNRPFLGAVAFLLGAIVGSFLNVVSLRMPKMMERNWRDQCRQLFQPDEPAAASTPYNLAFPPSHCPKCQHAIQWWENIPVISYVILGGKCSGCKTGISIRYPLVEMGSAILSTIVVCQFGASIQGIAALFFTWTLLTLAIIDFDTQFLPDDLTLPLLWGGLLLGIFAVFADLQDAVIGAAAGYLCLWSVYWMFKWTTGKEGMGYGDFKLLAALGAWLGWQALPAIILVASCAGSVIGISLILLRNRDSQIPIPFGPYLAIAGWITMVWQDEINILFQSLFVV